MRVAMIGLRGIPTAYGGIERHVEAIAPRLAGRGHDVTVYGRSHCCEPGTFRGVRVRTVRTLETKHLETAIYAAGATLDALHRDFDLLHFHALGPSLFASLPRIGRVPVVVTVHGLDWRRAKWGALATGALRVGEITSFAFADRTVVVSQALRDHYRDGHGVAAEYIPNGVDLPGAPGSDGLRERFGVEPGSYALFVGRLVPEKGVHHLVRAWRRLGRDVPLVVAGGGSHADEYETRVRALAAGDRRIVFPGFVGGEELARLYANARLFVLPSEIEGLSVALLEAMSFALPVLVSDLPENLEVIDDGEAVGERFRNGDDGDLAARVTALLDAPERAASLGRAARAAVERRFVWDRVVDRLDDVYRDVLDRSGGAASSRSR